MAKTTSRTTSRTTINQPEVACEASNYSAHIEGRVGRLEGAVESLVSEVQETSKSVKLIAENLSGFRESFLGELNKDKTPQWPMIASVAGFIITIMTILGAFLGFMLTNTKDSINANTTSISQVSNRLNARSYSDGETNQWHRTVDGSLTELNKNLQREMLLINDTTTAKVANLDDKLQSEFGGINKRMESQIADIKQETNRINTWKDSVQTNRWTKEDQQHFDTALQDQLKELRTVLYHHIEVDAPKTSK
jgi:hypothetical protein